MLVLLGILIEENQVASLSHETEATLTSEYREIPRGTGVGECSYGVYGKILCGVPTEVITKSPVA